MGKRGLPLKDCEAEGKIKRERRKEKQKKDMVNGDD